MKRKHLLFLLLFAMFAPWAANAQETLTVHGENTTTNSNVPVWGLWADNSLQCEILYPASELEDMAGGVISALKFYTNSTSTNIGTASASSNWDGTFTIFLKEVEATTLSAFTGTTGATTVLEAQIGVVNGEMTIEFTNTYTYGGGNLLVGIYYATGGHYCSVSWIGNAVIGASIYGRSGQSYSATQGNFIPKTTFTYTPPTCPIPSNLTVSGITSNSATATWESEATSFIFEFKKSTEETWTPLQATNLFFTMADLAPNTTYDVRVRAICSTEPWEQSVYARKQFTTDCDPTVALDYSENFDGYQVPSEQNPSTRTLPDCWYAINTTTYATYSVYPTIYYSGTSFATSSPNSLCLYSEYSSYTNFDPQPQYAIMPNMDDLSGVQITLKAKGFNANSTLKVGTMSDPMDASSFTMITEQALTNSFQTYSFDIPTNTTDKYIAFMIDAATSSRVVNCVYIDDIVIPTCARPSGLHISSLTAHRVDIEWDAEEGEMFQEICLSSGFDPNTPPTDWNIVPDTDHTAYWEGLAPSTFYGIWVRKYCSDTDQSDPVYITFTTPEVCPAPTGLQVVEGSITSTGASFTWDAEEGVTFQYFTIENPWSDFEPAVDQNWTDLQNNTIGWANAFSPNTTQRFYLRKNCGGEDGYSDYIYVEFRTLCGPISLISNYTENFNDYTGVTSTTPPTSYPNDELPHCWQFLNRSENSNTYPMAFISSFSGYPVNGNCLFFRSSSTTPLYAILPEFAQAISGYQLTFTYRNEGTSAYNGTLYVGYMTDPADASTFVQTLACERTTTLTTKTAYFANAPQGSFMAFKYEGGTNNNYYLGIDNVVVSMAPACFPTGTLSYSNVQGHSVDLSWELVDANQMAWEVEYSESPQFFESVTAAVDATTNENFVLEGLDPLTTYYVRVHANCGDGYGDYSNEVTFTTDVACPAPTGLRVAELTAYKVTIEWDAEEGEMFQTYFPGGQPTYPFDPTTPPTNWNVQPQTENHSTWSNLTPETTYGIWLRRYCNDDEQSEPIYITFTTLDACPVPTNLAATNLTQNTADLSWEASEDVTSYTVKYRRTAQVVGIPEQFSTSSTPSDWEVKTGLLESILNEGGSLTESAFPNWNFGTGNGVFDSHAKLNIYGTSCKSWLITPPHTVEGGDAIAFDLALTAWSGTLGEPATTGTDDRFVVLITDDNCETWDILREWNNSGSEYVYNDITCSATGEKVTIPMGNAYMGRTVRFAFYGESTVSNADNNLHIDNVVIGTSYAAGGWSESQNATTSAQLAGLEANMEYEVIVKSDCSDPEEYSEPITFKTLDESKKVFIGGYITDNDPEGNQWKNPYNWSPYGMPSATNDNPDKDVILRHDAVISGQNTVVFAFANSITFEGTPLPTLTIEDGNELLLNTNIDVQNQVTVKKNIIGYTPNTKDRYYLISIPAHYIGQNNPVNSGLVTTESDYDLYKWSFDANDGIEWRNYKQETFHLDQAEGYLYANAADVELHFTGEVRNNRENYTIFNLNYDEQNEHSFNGWELCGNPFTCDAYLSTNSQTMVFYRMNADGTDFETAMGAIKPMEGFFSQNTVNGESMVLSRTAPTKNMSRLNLVLSQGRATKDNAIIRFDEGNTLEKLSFRENSSKVYMPVEGKDYAVAAAESMGEMPVSFKAETNDTYTLSVNAEEVSFAYLHLIDNLTGTETDLLANPSYSFEARTTDYANRFKLVFATGNNSNDDNFAFFSNGSFVINNEGNATLQVVDVTGRILKSESINGCANVNVNAAPGVYMLRLINGDNVKVQKVVVR